MTSMPPRYGRRGTGTTTLPSSCWKFSKMDTIIRGTAHAVALSVCTNSVLPPPPPAPPFLPPFLPAALPPSLPPCAALAAPAPESPSEPAPLASLGAAGLQMIVTCSCHTKRTVVA